MRVHEFTSGIFQAWLASLSKTDQARRQAFQHRHVFVLQEDLDVRGIHAHTELRGITYAQLVELTVQHKPVVSWSR